jgi:hypothetical protein
MKKHIEQACHNENFHNSISEHFSNDYYDWKITVLFYVAIHYLKALAEQKRIKIGETHYEIENNINPIKNDAKMRITKGAWDLYRNLFNYSRTARYDGITDPATFQLIKESDHKYCLEDLDKFKKYLKSVGLEDIEIN